MSDCISLMEREMERHLVMAALGCAIRGKHEWINRIASWFEPSHLLDPFLQALYSASVKLAKQDAPIEPCTLALELYRQGCGSQGTPRDIAELLHGATTQACHLSYYAQQVVFAHQRRVFSEELASISDQAREAEDPSQVLQKATELAEKCPRPPNHAPEFDESLPNALLDDLYSQNTTNGVKLLEGNLCKLVGHVDKSALVVVSARTGGGKSVFMGQVAMENMLRGKNVLYVTLEMSDKQVCSRWVSHLSGTPRTGDKRELLGGIGKLRNLLAEGRLQFLSGATDIDTLLSQAAGIAASHTLDLLVVDYLQLVGAKTDRNANREQEVAKVSRKLKNFALSNSVPVLTASQLNRANEDAPAIRGLRESGAIGNDADIVLFLKPEDMQAAQTKVTVEVGKNRDGGLGQCMLWWDKPIWTMRDIDEHDAQIVPLESTAVEPEVLSGEVLP